MIRKSRIFIAAVVAFMLCCATSMRAQEVATVDFRADIMTSIKVADSTALCLVGHVVFFHNGAVITCDSAVRYSDQLMDCYRNVVVNKDSTFVYGDKADYNGELNEARIYSPIIKMVDKDATLYTHNFTFNTLTSIGRYYGGGSMSQKDNLMESEDGYYYSDTRELIGVNQVQMRNPQYTIDSDSVSYNLDSEIATFNTTAYIWNDKDEFLTAKRGNYDNKTKQYTFTDNSYILTKTQEVWADTIVYKQELQDALLLNNVQIDDQEQSAMAFGNYARYWGETQQALLTRDPVIVSYNQDKSNQADTQQTQAADTLYMRSDTLFLYTVNRFKKDSIPDTPKASDSLTLSNPLPNDTIPEGKPAITTAPSSGEQLPTEPQPGSKPQPAGVGKDTPLPADSATHSSPLADSLQNDKSSLPDSVAQAVPTAKTLKKAAEEKRRLEKADARKAKDAERAARIKAKAKELRAKADAEEKALQQREQARQRKELNRKFFKGRATSEDSLALHRLDSLAMITTDTLATDSTTQEPQAILPEPTPPSTADSTAQVIAPADSLVRVVRGYYNVKIYRSDFQAVCDSIVGFSADSTIHMYTHPILWNEDNQITAQTVDIFTKNQTISKAVCVGDPLMCARVDDIHYNQVKGKEIISYFRQGNIYKTDVNGNGQTYYYMEDGDSTDRYISGFLVVECADITFRFKDQQLDELVYRGNPAYTIYPMDQIPETQSQFMKGFKWESELRPTRAQIFNRTIRPSERARFESLPKPTYPITQIIDQQREQLTKTGWIDRMDRYLGQEAVDFVHSLEN